MKQLKKIILNLHQATGAILSLMFVVWFLSGLVLIFAGFPHASREERFMHLQAFTKNDFESIQNLPDSISGSIELEKLQNQTVYQVYSGRREQKVYNAQSLELIIDFSKVECCELAESFMGFSVSKSDLITELDQWMPWSYYGILLPIYKCHINDPAHTVIYVSSKTGSIIQQTNRQSRWAARLGAIPHWIYFRSLRLNAQLWSQVVIWISSIGVFISLTGIIAGFIRLRKRKKRKQSGDKRISPYRKFWYKWHHITGFFFGLFVFTFILSGLFSMTNLPEWLVPQHRQFSPQKSWNKTEELSYQSIHELWLALDNKINIRKVAWKSSLGQPVFWVYYNDYQQPEVYISKADTIYKQTQLCISEVEERATKLFPDCDFSVTEQAAYSNYYQKSGMRNHPLPVYRIDWDDADRNQLYINPKTGLAIASLNKRKNIRRWLYRGLHTFNIEYLKQHEFLRKSLLVFLSLGGLLVSVTGLVLAWKWLKRKLK